MKKIFKVIVASAFLLCFGNAQNNLDLSSLTKSLLEIQNLLAKLFCVLAQQLAQGNVQHQLLSILALTPRNGQKQLLKEKHF